MHYPKWLYLLLLSTSLVFGAIHSRQYGTFPTSDLRHVEPLKALNIDHEDIGTQRKLRIKNGLHQPYPDTIKIQFKAFGKKHKFHNLQVMDELFSPHSTYTVDHGDGIIVTRPNELTAYSEGHFWKENGAVVVMHTDGNFTATFMHEGVMHYAEPLHDHTQKMDHRVASLLSQHAVYNMIVFRSSDVIVDSNNPPMCGVQSKNGFKTSFSRRNLRSLLSEELQSWDCNNDGVKRKLNVGFATDYSFYVAKQKSEKKVKDAIASYIAASSEIYTNQVNVALVVGDFFIKATDVRQKYESWNQVDPFDCVDIREDLKLFSEWRAKVKPDSMGIWHLMTQCYTSGYVGLAARGALCLTEVTQNGKIIMSGTGLSGHISQAWLTVAHEIGHNFGMDHSFSDKTGTRVHYGGIMDYGDGKYKNKYQFNTPRRKAETCAEIKKALGDKKENNPYYNTKYVSLKNCIGSLQPKCGNKVVEPPEKCDGGKCCGTNCLPLTTAQCFVSSDCCTNCKFEPTSKKCTFNAVHNAGYCHNGICVQSICSKYEWSQGCTGKTTKCKEECNKLGACVNIDSYHLNGQSGSELRTIPDGAICQFSSTKLGKCSKGICSEVTVVKPQWVTSSWSACSKSCGNGKQTRTVICKKQGSTQADTVCTGAGIGNKPSTEQVCKVKSCFAWKTTPYSACSQDCAYSTGAKGTQSRNVVCLKDGSVVVNDLMCSGTKPAVSQNCNTARCPVKWVSGTFGSCSKQCGPGVQVRTVECKEYRSSKKIVRVADSFCSGTKPSSSQSCNLAVCAQYSWLITSSSACTPSTCGVNGKQTRIIKCIDSKTKVVQTDEKKCTGSKPATELSCTNPSCMKAVWAVSKWSPDCPTKCGSPAQIQKRKVLCRNIADAQKPVVLDEKCKASKPLTTRQCSATSVCPVYKWTASPWGDCLSNGKPPACKAAGDKERTVNCVNSAVSPPKVVTDSLCNGSGAKPQAMEACQGLCPISSYKWVAGQFNKFKCTKNCGTGLMTRTVYCMSNKGRVADKFCTSQKPASEANCNQHPCPSWVVSSEWSKCTAKCGGSSSVGKQNRTVLCKNHKSLIVNQNLCKTSRPPNEQVCQAFRCPSWYVGEWSLCSRPCGGGIQKRPLSCRLANEDRISGFIKDTSLCPLLSASRKTTLTQQKCNLQPCPDNYWDVDSKGWSSCSKSCGSGTQTATIVCWKSSKNSVVADSNCLGEKPLSTRSCNTDACPTVQWSIGKWMACSSECEGIQTRQVECVHMYYDGFSKVIDSGLCQKLGERPWLRQSCNVNACGGSPCYSGKCACPNAMYGPSCKSVALIENVEILGTKFAVPPGQPLTVRWQSKGSIKKVSILLQGARYSKFMTMNIPNSHVYQIITPSDLPAGAYSITVFSDQKILSKSSSFTSKPPCDYTNCHNGTCNTLTPKCDCSKTSFGGLYCDTPIKQPGIRSKDCKQGKCPCDSNYHGTHCTTPIKCKKILECFGQSHPKLNKTGCPTHCVSFLKDVCPIGFAGKLCDKCVLKCSTGKPADDCRSCKCPPGYFGNQCECEYGMVSLHITPNTIGKTPNELNLLAADIARAIDMESKWVSVVSTNFKDVTVNVILRDRSCGSFKMMAYFNEPKGTVSGVMLAASTIQQQLSDSKSKLRNGIMSKHIEDHFFNFTSPPSLINKCATRNCNYCGRCNLATGKCICEDGFIGDNCDMVDLCYGITCNGQGTCASGICTCRNGYTGVRCHISPKPCGGKNCIHGSCQSNVCVCDEGWAGFACDIETSSCYKKNCSDHGSCFDGKCSCYHGWKGVNCSIKVNFCPPGKCHHHGTCTNGVCKCAKGYEGQFCEQSPGNCFDGQKNQNEEKADCGGVCKKCPSCTNGLKDWNEGGIDCGGICPLQCPTCGDGVKNGLEKGVDCGAPGCAVCGAAPTCKDGSKNGQETGIDCGGPKCHACRTYKWFASRSWSECTVVCGEGIQTRLRFCKEVQTNSTVDDAFCSNLHPVPILQTCNQHPCGKYSWKDGNWGSCSSPTSCAPKGLGIQYKPNLVCMRNNKEIVPQLFCDFLAVNKPVTTQKCGKPCDSAAYSWYVDPLWGPCSVSCGGGKQWRNVVCQTSQQKIVNDKFCKSVEKPIDEQSCNRQICIPYKWHVCPWSECTAECGGGADGGTSGGSMLGEQTRKIVCKQGNSLVDDSYCNATERKTIAVSKSGCNNKPCTTHNWMTSTWSSCIIKDHQSGIGYRERTYHCHAPDGSNTILKDCEDHIKSTTPVTKQKCTAIKCGGYVSKTKDDDVSEAIPNMIISNIALVSLIAFSFFGAL